MLPLLAMLTASTALRHGAALWPPVDLYPAGARAAHLQGQVGLRIGGDATAPCVVSSRSPSRELDTTACALALPRIAVLPDRPSAPLKVKVRWYLPAEQPISDFGGAIPFDPPSWVTPTDIPPSSYSSHGTGRTEVAFDIATDGSVSACGVTASSGTPELDQRLCSLITQRAAFLPAMDANGSARIAHATTAVIWFTRP